MTASLWLSLIRCHGGPAAPGPDYSSFLATGSSLTLDEQGRGLTWGVSGSRRHRGEDVQKWPCREKKEKKEKAGHISGLRWLKEKMCLVHHIFVPFSILSTLRIFLWKLSAV